MSLFGGRGLLLAGHRLFLAFPDACIRPCALPMHGQTAPVTNAAVASDVHEPLDIESDLRP